MADDTVPAPLDRFSPAVAQWFSSTFSSPTDAQSGGWHAIKNHKHTLICAPTGSGKTLAAFLSSIDSLVSTPSPSANARTRVLYISPLRALAFDVEKNLRAPLAGIAHAAERLGHEFHTPIVGMRTGDTSAKERQALVRNPPDLLITTPESLYLMLTSAARSTLANVDTVIIDEIHAMAATKRGAHLMLSLERLEEVCAEPPQRIGLSATQRPLEEIAHFLGGYTSDGVRREVAIVNAGVRKELDLQVVVPVEDMGDLGRPQPPTLGALHSGPASVALAPRRTSIWPSIYPRILELILEHKSTIIFCNSRRQSERLAAKINELAIETEVHEETAGDLVRAHHGSLAREQRVLIEDQLKRGEVRAIVATSSLELGIDMGAVDLVIQVESPGAVSRGLQRVGRAGHQVGEPSRGRMFPKHRGDLVEAAVVAKRMVTGEIETTRFLRNSLDVLAQQIVAHLSIAGEMEVSALALMVRRCAGFHEISDEQLNNLLDLLAGRYPSDEFASLKPRIVWDRVNGKIRAREGAQRLAVTNGGTIPDRGLFGVFLIDGTRVGELDEEMVYETRPGETFILGASTWRIEDITFDRVVVSPAPGVPGRMPFWHGDQPGRPIELGRAVGEFIRTVRDTKPTEAMQLLQDQHSLDELAAQNLLSYLTEQAESTGVVPDDRTIVIERFRDEIGDWRVCLLSPFGTPVHAPWAMAIEHTLGERHGIKVETMWGDDGIVLRLPEAIENLEITDLLLDPLEIEELVVANLPRTSLFAARFRECAARSLLLPRRRPDQRTPLWQQRQRAADLLAVAAKYPSFPILLETSRECIQDVFDVPALKDVLGSLQARRIRAVQVDTPKASPFSQSLLFNWIAAYMYEGDAPLAERRAAALALDRDLLADLLGADELRELLDSEAIVAVELDAQCLSDGRRARNVDELHDVLRRVGDLTVEEINARCESGVAEGLNSLLGAKRVISVAVSGETRYIVAEDAARYRDALGCALPLGLPEVFTTPVARPLEELVARFARTHAPFHAADIARRFAITEDRALSVLLALESSERVVRGEFRPEGVEREWCDVDVLRMVRRRSLAKLRHEVEPVEQSVLAAFLATWHGIGQSRVGMDALVETVGVLQGAAITASTLETFVLPRRVRGYRASDLDSLCTNGEVVWVGAGAIGSSDGRVRMYFADQLPLLIHGYESPNPPDGEGHNTIRALLAQRGASFWGSIKAALPSHSDAEVLAMLWDLVWAGEVTNDSFAALRAYLAGGKTPRVSNQRRASGRVLKARPARLARVGPPAGAGRWSLVRELVGEPNQNVTTAVMHAVATQLLERHGVVTREAVLAEGVVGGFSGVYPILRLMEEKGQVRRGYFVNGLGAAQFAVVGAVDQLRSTRDTFVSLAHDSERAAPNLLAATDPAQPYGAAIDWPHTEGRPARVVSAVVILRDGEPLAWFDFRSHNLCTFTNTDHRAWATAIAEAVKNGELRGAEIRKANGVPVSEISELTEALAAAGFVESYKGWVFR